MLSLLDIATYSVSFNIYILIAFISGIILAYEGGRKLIRWIDKESTSSIEEDVTLAIGPK